MTPLFRSLRKGEATIEDDFITIDQGGLDPGLYPKDRAGSQTAYNAKRFSTVEGAQQNPRFKLNLT